MEQDAEKPWTDKEIRKRVIEGTLTSKEVSRELLDWVDESQMAIVHGACQIGTIGKLPKEFLVPEQLLKKNMLGESPLENFPEEIPWERLNPRKWIGETERIKKAIEKMDKHDVWLQARRFLKEIEEWKNLKEETKIQSVDIEKIDK